MRDPLGELGELRELGEPPGGPLGEPPGHTVVYLSLHLPTLNTMPVCIHINKCKGKQASLYKKTYIDFNTLGCGCTFNFSGSLKFYTFFIRCNTYKLTFHWTLKK